MRYEVRLQPNPTSGTVTVESGEWRVESVTVTDMSGREVMATTGVHGGTPLHLDISHLSPGVYMVTVVTPQGTASQRLVVQ